MTFEKAKGERDTTIRDEKISIAAKSINLKVYLRIYAVQSFHLQKETLLCNFECLELIYLAYIKSLEINRGRLDEIFFFFALYKILSSDRFLKYDRD